jgi:foldase protein PrsA
VFGAGFSVLFALIAIAEGIGEPTIPSGDVILIQGMPDDLGRITAGDIDLVHQIELFAVSSGLRRTPRPGDPQYGAVKRAMTRIFIEEAWLRGEASELGIELTAGEVRDELKKLVKESFESRAELQQFLRKSHSTPEDLYKRVRRGMLNRRIEEHIAQDAPLPSHGEIEDYYEAAKDRFPREASRDVRLVVNKDRAKARQALAILRRDHAAGKWEKVVERFSEGPSAKKKGGLKKTATRDSLEEPLAAAVFSASKDQVEGPVKTKEGYAVFAVEKAIPKGVKTLKAVEAQIQRTLGESLLRTSVDEFHRSSAAEWTARTFCAAGYMTPLCANFKYDGHPPSANAACYEANPKGGLPDEGCPAPVTRRATLEPGSVTPLAPQGKVLVVRPGRIGANQPKVTGGR